MRWAPALFLCLTTVTPAAHAQLLSGTLLEKESRLGLAGGLVTLLEQDSVVVARTQTDSVGEFSFTVAKRGSYRLRAELPGFPTATSSRLTLAPLDTVDVEFSLARGVVVLEPLVVTGRSRRITPAARRFYDRAKLRGFGTFITREDIQKVHARRTTDLLRGIAGVRTSPVLGGSAVTVREGCQPTIYVDGNRVFGYRTIDGLVQPSELEGLEVYRSADHAPAEFTGLQAGCAVILMWTRIE